MPVPARTALQRPFTCSPLILPIVHTGTIRSTDFIFCSSRKLSRVSDTSTSNPSFVIESRKISATSFGWWPFQPPWQINAFFPTILHPLRELLVIFQPLAGGVEFDFAFVTGFIGVFEFVVNRAVLVR